MNSIARRIAAGATLAIAPALIALGTATAGHADTTVSTNGSTSSVHTPTHHEAFPHQAKIKPGTPEHHRHQKHQH